MKMLCFLNYEKNVCPETFTNQGSQKPGSAKCGSSGKGSPGKGKCEGIHPVSPVNNVHLPKALGFEVYGSINW